MTIKPAHFFPKKEVVSQKRSIYPGYGEIAHDPLTVFTSAAQLGNLEGNLAQRSTKNNTG